MRTTLRRLHPEEPASGRRDRTALATVAWLVGGLLGVSGLLQRVALFSVIAASVMTSKPLLNADQNLLLGMGFLLSSCVGLLHPFRRSTPARQKGAASAT